MWSMFNDKYNGHPFIQDFDWFFNGSMLWADCVFWRCPIGVINLQRYVCHGTYPRNMRRSPLNWVVVIDHTPDGRGDALCGCSSHKTIGKLGVTNPWFPKGPRRLNVVSHSRPQVKQSDRSNGASEWMACQYQSSAIEIHSSPMDIRAEFVVSLGESVMSLATPTPARSLSGHGRSMTRKSAYQFAAFNEPRNDIIHLISSFLLVLLDLLLEFETLSGTESFKGICATYPWTWNCWPSGIYRILSVPPIGALLHMCPHDHDAMACSVQNAAFE